MPDSPRILLVVPTRNRAALAGTAIRSILTQERDDVRVLVSDNSTLEQEQDELAAFCRELGDDRVGYVRPPAPLPMAEHWEWAMRAGLQPGDSTHVGYVTDRMIVRRDALAELVALAGEHPDRIVSYTLDRIEDHRLPVRQVCERWSGGLFDVPATRLLWLSSRANPHMALPRMLNCLAPVPVIEEVSRRFGTVFGSASPDYCFAYRALAVVDSILYYDRAPLVHYALARSNGAALRRGMPSPDRSDFEAQLGEGFRNHATPVPEIDTVNNAIMQEYCTVKAETGSERFPELVRSEYLAMIAYEASLIEDDAERRKVNELLALNGWADVRRGVTMRRLSQRVTYYARHPVWFARRAAGRLVRRDRGPGFETAAAAVEHARTNPPPRTRSLLHLRLLLEPPGGASEVR